MKRTIILSLIISVTCPVVHMARVFVYGTLKNDQPNHFRMRDPDNGHAEFLACARTEEPYPLVIATKYNIPFLLNVHGRGKRVYGEIYSVDKKMLKFLDKFEHCPQLYSRTAVKLKVLDGDGERENKLTPGTIEEAFMYIKTTHEPDWLQKPTYESYDANGDHGLKYVPPGNRSPDWVTS